VTAPSGPLLELRFRARPAELREVRHSVREAVLRGGVGEGCAADVVMAVDEACQNVIRHAYAGNPEGTIELRIEREGDALVVSLIDYAPRVDPAEVRGRDLDELRPGGLGTHLIRSAMDEVEFRPPPPGCGNLLRMVKRLHPGAGEGGS
jgi:sigma-B regulation protein RsbU (phosphoserine phosphatase)